VSSRPFKGAEPGSWEASPRAAYAAAKRLPEELLEELGLRDRKWRGKLILELPWHDQDGQEVAVHRRFALDGKPEDKFKWPTGTKAKGLLYGLPRRKRAIGEGWALLVEGESDCHTAWAAELPAFGIPGATMFSDELTAPCLEGIGELYPVKEPGKAGEEFAAALATSSLRSRVRIMSLNGYKDLSELWLGLGGDREAFRAAIEEARQQAQAVELEDEPEPGSDLLPVVSLSKFVVDKDEEAAAPLVGNEERNLVPRYGLVVVGGMGGAAKTTYTVDAVAHLASGTPWEGSELERALRVLLIDVEGPREPYRAKLERKLAAWQGKPFAENVFVLDGPEWGRFSFAEPQDRQRLVNSCRALGIDLVVANPLGRLGMEGGGTPDEVGRFVEYLRACGLWDSLAFWLVHHYNRAPMRDVLLRLSGAWDRDADTIIGLAREGQERKTKRTWAKIRWAFDGGPEEVTEVLAWDVESMGFRPVEAKAAAAPEEVRRRTLAWLVEHPSWHSKSAVRKGVTGEDQLVDEALWSLLEEGLVRLQVGAGRIERSEVGVEEHADLANRRTPTYWRAADHAGLRVGVESTPTDADLGPQPRQEGRSRRSAPYPKGEAPPTRLLPTGVDNLPEEDPGEQLFSEPSVELDAEPEGGHPLVDDRLLTAAEVAELLSVPLSWVRQETQAERLPHLKLGRYRRYEREAVLAWLETLRSGQYRRHQPKAPA
jgi:excisionase family DNA binding protein